MVESAKVCELEVATVLRLLQSSLVVSSMGGLIYVWLRLPSFGHVNYPSLVILTLVVLAAAVGPVYATCDVTPLEVGRKAAVISGAALAMWIIVVLGAWSVGRYFIPAALALSVFTVYASRTGVHALHESN